MMVDLGTQNQILLKETLRGLNSNQLNVLHYGDVVVLINSRNGEVSSPIMLSFAEQHTKGDRRGPKSELKFEIAQNFDSIYQSNNIALKMMNSGWYLGLGRRSISIFCGTEISGKCVVDDISVWHLTAVELQEATLLMSSNPEDFKIGQIPEITGLKIISDRLISLQTYGFECHNNGSIFLGSKRCNSIIKATGEVLLEPPSGITWSCNCWFSNEQATIYIHLGDTYFKTKITLYVRNL